MKLAPGQSFGRYLIEAFIGQGGMGRVFRAQDTLLERPVALKVILPDQAKDAEAVPRFFREAKLAARLTHPNAVHLYDLGEIEGVPFMAMELIDGRSLHTFIGDEAYRPERKLNWMLGVARGLAAAHDRGLIHRDVKPANVMVSLADDLAKIVDFGLAKRLKTTPVMRTTFQTQTGFVLGTPAYMAPEALAGDEPDARSDQFGWALTTHTLVAGRNPRAADPMLERPIEMLSDVYDAIPRRAALAVMRALSSDPAMRFRSMAELADALAEGLLTGTLVPPPVAPHGPNPMTPVFGVPAAAHPPERRFAHANIWHAYVPADPPPPPGARGAAAAPIVPDRVVSVGPAKAAPTPKASRQATPKMSPAPPPKVSAAPPPRTDERRSLEDNARACAKRMRYLEQHKFSVAKAGLTAYKQEKALEGTPFAADIAKERWAFTRRRACPFAALRLLAFAPHGDTAFALSAFERDEEALELRGGTWHPIRLDGVRAFDIECARVLPDGRVAIGGRHALAAVAEFGGAVEHWSVRGQVGHVIVDVRSTGDGAAFRTSFSAVDARTVDGALELAFVGQGNGAGVAAVGTEGRLTQHVSNRFGPIAAVACGRIIMIAGKELGIVTDEGIDAAGSEAARKLVSIDANSALAIGQRGFLYFNPLNTSLWQELAVDAGVPIHAAVASRQEIYAVDERGTILRRSASWTWVAIPDGVARALDPIAMWAGRGHVRIVCGDGAIVEGRRSG